MAAPQVHVAALKNPAMLGGPFLNYGADRVGEVRELLQATTAELSPLMELAGAVKELEEMLAVQDMRRDT